MALRTKRNQAVHQAATWVIDNAQWHEGLEGAATELVRHDPFAFEWGGGRGEWSFKDQDVPEIVAEAEKILADAQAREDAFREAVRRGGGAS